LDLTSRVNKNETRPRLEAHPEGVGTGPDDEAQLCMCLSTSLSSIESALGWLAGRGAVLVVGRLKKNRQGHPLWIYGLAL
jgi:hypothetical protein